MVVSTQMKSPLVSVIVPAYNRADCVENAVSSILAQTYSNLEIIVVDDGSTDGTLQILERLSQQERRVRFIRQPRNQGAQAARNAGINASNGTWIAFLDSDDTWVGNSLEARLEVAWKEHAKVVHSAGDMRDEQGRLTRYQRPPLSGSVYPELLRSEGPMYQGLLVAREALHAIGGLDDRIVAFQEWDTALALGKRFEFGYVGESTFVWDCRRGDTMSKNYLRAGQGYEQVFHKRYMDILRLTGPSTLAEHYRHAAKWYEAAAAERPAKRCRSMAKVWSGVDGLVRGARTALHGR